MKIRSYAGALLLLLSIALLPAVGCGGPATTTKPRTYDTITTMSGLRYVDFEKGTGPEVFRGDTVRVDYAGYLLNGMLFDTSMDEIAKRFDYRGVALDSLPPGSDRSRTFDRGGMVDRYPFEPIEFTVGVQEVIVGWDEGLTTNMRVGGRRLLIVPPHLGYGSAQTGIIPPNATLVFDLTVVDKR